MNNAVQELKKSLITSLWFMFLTFPIMVIKVNTVEKVVNWRWSNMIFIGVLSFVMSYFWRGMLRKKERGDKLVDLSGIMPAKLRGLDLRESLSDKKIARPVLIILLVAALIFPFAAGMYQTSIMTTALMYIILGLGLNIVIGLGGMLHLGYAAFYSVGAYTYAILHRDFGIGFWVALPLGAILAMFFGMLLGFPVLRLKGDYLAIVTLGFAEIVRIVQENWNDFSSGPSGIANIPRPSLFGIKLSVPNATIYTYMITLFLVLFTIFVVRRLENSRLGRAWEAMREDAIASESMGVNITTTKLTAFALGSFWAGMVGVIFAAKTTFVNPASFTLMESVLVLCIIVLGGMGSTTGVIVGALIIVLLPEYLRAFSEYRMLLYGGVLVMMMVFRPNGIIQKVRKRYILNLEEGADGGSNE
ncbi:branched-chain amino acid ABC transporter permease [Marispirochaeta sp.]|uniref:ABC transporter permease subunit n=1 Tax=Marispirochaeta sp. TaxID=2038653 RepID=UPI0029C77E28|nr:branched-chain amino acid ABC transporter permease [Marispirochaeta sp.]